MYSNSRRRLFKRLLLSLAFCSLASAAETPDPIIDQIRKDFEQAQQIKKSAKKIQRNDYGENGEGNVTAYRTKGKDLHIAIVENEYAIGHHGGRNSYYYHPSGEMYFAFEFSSSFYTAADPSSTVTERRLYFRDGKPVRCLERSITAISNHKSKLEKSIQKECSEPVNPELVIKESKDLLKFVQESNKKQKN